MLIDTHFHLDLMDNMQSLIREFSAVDVGIIAVGTTPKAFVKERQICVGARNINVGLGLHPQLVAEREHEIELFLNLVKESRYIGEVGIDFNTNYITSKEQQVSCFRKIVKSCADEGGKILSIHSVKSAGVVIEELNSARVFANNVCIFHWFTGSVSEHKRAIEDGAYFSINPRMVRTKRGQETIKAVPADRILLETDAPFTTMFETVKELKTELEKLVIRISEVRAQEMRGWIEDNTARIFV